MTEVGRLLAPWIDAEREYAFLLGHDNAGGVSFISRVAIGDAHRVSVPLTRFLGQALALGFQRVSLAHSHPSGSLTVSEDDKTLTRQVLDAATLCGLTLVDHVIVSGAGSVSLVQLRILEAAEPLLPQAAELRPPLDAVTPFDHRAFYANGAPNGDWDADTGLRCSCGREVVSSDETRTGWAHVGIGDFDDLTGLDEWHAAQRIE